MANKHTRGGRRELAEAVAGRNRGKPPRARSPLGDDPTLPGVAERTRGKPPRGAAAAAAAAAAPGGTRRTGTAAKGDATALGLPAFPTALRGLTERTANERRMVELQERLTSLAAELVMAEERERRRIAVEVHDNLSQSLVLAKMKLGALRRLAGTCRDGAAVGRGLEDVTTLVDEVLQQTRTLTFELSPPVLYELGFEAALEWLGERFAQRHRLRVHVDARRRATKLPEQTSVLLFQCVRELLTNTAKHADATEARVAVRRSSRTVRVVVEDNGRGFDPHAPGGDDGDGDGDGTAGGFGLFSLGARLAHVGGQMDVKTRCGGPTRVTLTVSIPDV